MIAIQAGGRQITSAEDMLDVGRSIADRSSDPAATYDSFLLGLEMGMACGALRSGLSAAIGSARVEHLDEDRVISDPRKPMIRKAPSRPVISGADFPTEWTLDP